MIDTSVWEKTIAGGFQDVRTVWRKKKAFLNFFKTFFLGRGHHWLSFSFLENGRGV